MEIFKLLGKIAIDGIDKVQNDLEQLSEKTKKIGSSVSEFGDKVSGVGSKLMPITAALGGIAAASSKMAMDFEDSIAKVNTIADTSQVPLADLEAAILELSNESGIASSEIAENVYNAISAGQKTGDAVAFVEKATQLARAGFAESGDALDILTTIMNAYKLEASEVDDVSNKLIMTQNLGKTTVGELSSAMGKAIPTAKSVGVNLDELCGSYAVMTANGIATAETTTYLNSMLNELGKQGTSAELAFRAGTESIKEGGLSMKEAMEMGWSLTDVLSILDEEAYKSGTSINNLFGSAEAGKAAAVLWDNAEGLNSAVEQMGESAGATDIAFGKLETTSYQIQKAVNEFKNTAIELGTTIMGMLAPYIEIISSKIHQLSDWFKGLSDAQKEQIVRIGAIVAAIGPLLLIGGKIIAGVGTLISVLGFLVSPIGLVVAAIAALTAGFVYLWNTNDQFQEAVRNGFQLTWEILLSLWETIGQPIFDSIMNIVGMVKEWFTVSFGDMGIAAQNTFQSISLFWEQHLKPCFEAIGNFLKTFLLPAFETVFKYFILPLISDVFNMIGNYWNNVLKPIFTGIIDFITGVFTLNWEKAFSGIMEIARGLLNGLISVFEVPFEAAKNIVNRALETIKNMFKFEWSLPKLKLPHFRIQGEFSLNPPSVPTFGIDWYKKAMDNPMIMDSPTAFGINKNGQIMAGGEAGSEVVSGTDTLMQMISQAVAAQNQVLVDVLHRILDAILNADENNVNAVLSGTEITLNNREFARLVKAVNYG